ncbi:hypothetical protein LINGRAHAP2_LOCUS32089 [Linum grandiflorum]
MAKSVAFLCIVVLFTVMLFTYVDGEKTMKVGTDGNCFDQWRCTQGKGSRGRCRDECKAKYEGGEGSCDPSIIPGFPVACNCKYKC